MIAHAATWLIRSRGKDTRSLPTAIAWAVVSACLGTDGDRSAIPRASLAYDSASVCVVANQLDFYSPTDSIGTEVLQIGQKGLSDPDYEFSGIADAALMAREVVVAEGDGVIRVYTNAGSYLRSIGGKGAGPGEFRGITWIAVADDTIWAYDPILRRVTGHLLRGELIRSWELGAVPMLGERRAYRAIAVTKRGGYLLAAWPPVQSGGAGPVRRSTTVLEWLPGIGAAWEVGPVPGQELSANPAGDVVYLGLPPFHRDLLAAYRHDDRVAMLDTGEDAIRTFVLGRLVEVARLHGNLEREVTEAVVQEYVESQVLPIPDRATRNRVAQNIRSSLRHTTLPVARSLLVGPDSTLWIERYAVSPEAPPFWIVIDANGIVQATVALPAPYVLRAIGRESVAVTVKDPDTDVEMVILLRRPPMNLPNNGAN